MDAFEHQKRYERARERVSCLKGFYSNLFSYLLVVPFLFWINFKTTSLPWALIPALGWGFGLLMHGMEAHGYHPFLGRNWEARKIKELMAADEQDAFANPRRN